MEGSETVPRAVVKGDTERDGDTDSESSSPLYLYPDLPTKSNIGERDAKRDIRDGYSSNMSQSYCRTSAFQSYRN
jgi:hypothetical protein